MHIKQEMIENFLLVFVFRLPESVCVCAPRLHTIILANNLPMVFVGKTSYYIRFSGSISNHSKRTQPFPTHPLPILYIYEEAMLMLIVLIVCKIWYCCRCSNEVADAEVDAYIRLTSFFLPM